MENKEIIARQAPNIFIANHQSFFDVAICCAVRIALLSSLVSESEIKLQENKERKKRRKTQRMREES